MNYYNEIDPYPAQWLENLAAAGHLPPGRVDTRGIADVCADDVRGAVQAHFFAGIGGWPLALRLAGWPDDMPVWTGSCPCQPFSVAGKGKGEADERHLWPEFRRLIAECRPPVVFGEQVASAAGRAWLAAVRADLEGLDYAVGAADLCGASVGAPHIRQRLFWVAYAHGRQSGNGGLQRGRRHLQWSGDSDARVGMAYLHDGGRLERSHRDSRQDEPGWRSSCGGDVSGRGEDGGLGNPLHARLPLRSVAEERRGDLPGEGPAASTAGPEDGANPWQPVVYLPCSDGKLRPTQPGLFPLAHGVSGRVGKLRAYGNAIIPQVAALFIRACMIEMGR